MKLRKSQQSNCTIFSSKRDLTPFTHQHDHFIINRIETRELSYFSEKRRVYEVLVGSYDVGATFGIVR